MSNKSMRDRIMSLLKPTVKLMNADSNQLQIEGDERKNAEEQVRKEQVLEQVKFDKNFIPFETKRRALLNASKLVPRLNNIVKYVNESGTTYRDIPKEMDLLVSDLEDARDGGILKLKSKDDKTREKAEDTLKAVLNKLNSLDYNKYFVYDDDDDVDKEKTFEERKRIKSKIDDITSKIEKSYPELRDHSSLKELLDKDEPVALDDSSVEGSIIDSSDEEDTAAAAAGTGGETDEEDEDEEEFARLPKHVSQLIKVNDDLRGPGIGKNVPSTIKDEYISALKKADPVAFKNLDRNALAQIINKIKTNKRSGLYIKQYYVTKPDGGLETRSYPEYIKRIHDSVLDSAQQYKIANNGEIISPKEILKILSEEFSDYYASNRRGRGKAKGAGPGMSKMKVIPMATPTGSGNTIESKIMKLIDWFDNELVKLYS